MNVENRIEADEPRPVCGRLERTPSEVLLALILEHVKTFNSQYREFDDLLAAWLRVKELEEIAARLEKSQETVEHYLKEILKPVGQKETEAPSQLTETAEMEETVAPAPEVISEDPAPKKTHGKTTGEGKGVTARAVRKRAALGALAKARANGVSLASIADESGLSLSDVIDLSNGKTKEMPIWSQLERGLRKLGYPPGGPEGEDAPAQPAEE